MKPNISVQLYTVRELAAHDMAGALKSVAAIGYEFVETAGFGNLNAKEMRAALDDNGLRVSGVLANLDELQFDLQNVIADAMLLESKYVTCPYLTPEWRNLEGYRKLAGVLNETGKELRDAGIALCYHNHDFEFERIEGKYALDWIFDHCDSELVQAEFDVCWLQTGGVDPAQYIEKYSGRVPSLHIKDLADAENKTVAEIGEGILNWPEIFTAAEKAGVGAYAVEQDVCAGNPLESLRISFENLQELA